MSKRGPKNRRCSIKGCDDKYHSSGFCRIHYFRNYYYGNPLHIPVRREKCSVNGCDRKHRARGFCGKHYQYFRANGRIDAVRGNSAVGRFRPVTIKGDIAEIELADGRIAIVDADDVDLVNQMNWSAAKTGCDEYVVTNLRVDVPRGKYNYSYRILYLHRHIMEEHFGIPKGLQIDHINHNGFDNRKENLRIVHHRVNLLNTKRKKTGKSSKYRGVWINAKTCKAPWQSVIRQLKDGKWKTLWRKTFYDDKEAAEEFDFNLIRLYGADKIIPESLNFPEKWDEYLLRLKKSSQ